MCYQLIAPENRRINKQTVHPYYKARAGGVINESQNCNGMYGLQAKKLQHKEEQEK